MSFNPTYTPEVIAAFDDAMRIIDELGQDHPRALAAIVRCVSLADPEFADRTLHKCGIELPHPTHCDVDGNALFSADQVAQAVGVSAADVETRIRAMAEAGDIVAVNPADVRPLQ